MAKEYVSGLHIVRVILNVAGGTTAMLWIAATPRDQAVAAVKKAVPNAKIVELTTQLVTKELAALHKLRAGDVAEVNSI